MRIMAGHCPFRCAPAQGTTTAGRTGRRPFRAFFSCAASESFTVARSSSLWAVPSVQLVASCGMQLSSGRAGHLPGRPQKKFPKGLE